MTIRNPQSRRNFIKQTALISIGFMALSRCSSNANLDKSGNNKIPLVKDPNGYLDLPAGFSYQIISKAGNKMNDGFLVPGRADGMGAFAGEDGKVIIIRNHENSPGSPKLGPFGKTNDLLAQIDPGLLYDAGLMTNPGLGGTTTFVYNEKTQKIEQEFLSLVGTYRNCAGGVTPWGSWLTCEEDVTKKATNIEKDHGFVFEVPATSNIVLQQPIALTDMGRFNHEAVAVDPKTGIVYLTEDEHDGLIYRFIPNVPGKLAEGGKLEALMILDQKSLDTRNWKAQTLALHQTLSTQWIPVEDVLSPNNDLRLKGFQQGAARFARGEGMWFGDNEMYFACTNGGPKKFGQVFKYVPSPHEGTPQENQQAGTLELFAESMDKTVLHMCDNLTIAPWGDVILSEDNGELNFIRGINQQGEIYDIACNRSSSSEFAGTVFSPSGKTMFVNIQENGDTLAITGPWNSLMS